MSLFNHKYLFIFILILILLLIAFNGKNKNIDVTDATKYYNINNNKNNYEFFALKNNNKFFFEENQEKLDYCINYGILIYDYYYDGKINFPNIGDYIQSLAALQYLPKNCKPYFVDRDSIQFYHGPKVKLIMNGWYYLHEGNKYVSSQIEPIYLSYHLNIYKYLTSFFRENLKNHSPIGCRDENTRDDLIKNGINAYFSSCLTTTLDIDFSINEKERTNEIIFIDYKFGNYPKADKYLLSLKAYNFTNITYTKHFFNLNLTHIERFQLAKKLLNKYARAKLVVSTRIHGALPCLSFKTPVILINKHYDYKRYRGLYELLNTIGINIQNKFEIKVNINEKGLVENSKKYLKYSKQLKDKLANI